MATIELVAATLSHGPTCNALPARCEWSGSRDLKAFVTLSLELKLSFYDDCRRSTVLRRMFRWMRGVGDRAGCDATSGVLVDLEPSEVAQVAPLLLHGT